MWVGGAWWVACWLSSLRGVLVTLRKPVRQHVVSLVALRDPAHKRSFQIVGRGPLHLPVVRMFFVKICSPDLPKIRPCFC